MLNPLDLIKAKRQHLARLANQNGAAGELRALDTMTAWLPRPKGPALRLLLAALRETGVVIKPSSFDAIELPPGTALDFQDPEAVRAALPTMVFIEIKTANQARVKADFSGFFFALTESEIAAAEVLGVRHRVVLFNRLTGASLLTSVAAIMARARSSSWQVSVQL